MVGKSRSEQTHRNENTRQVFSFIFVSLTLWTAVRLLFFYVAAPSLWGIVLFHYLPGWFAIVLTAISLAGIYYGSQIHARPSRQAKKNKGTEKTKRQDRLGNWKIVGIISLLFGILFLVFRVAWPFLGDGTTYFGFMYQFHEDGTITTQRNATPVLYLLYGIYYLYLKVTHSRGYGFFPFAVVSLVSGLLFTVTSLRLAKAFDTDRWIRILLFTLLISLGGTLFFFGYVEMYPLQYVFVLIYAYYAFQYVHGKAKLSTIAIALVLCIAFHLQNILLIPSFIFLFSLRGVQDRQATDRKKFVGRSLVVSAAVLTAFYIVASVTGLTSTEGSPLIPFSATGDSGYTLLSVTHVVDILNYHFLIAAVPILVILSCLAVGFKRIPWGNSYVLFLFINLFFLEAFLIGGGLNLGLGRDWDVCASLGIMFALIAAMLLQQALTGFDPRRVAIPIVAVAISGIVGWVAINEDINASVPRYEDLLAYYAPVIERKITSKGYENLRKYQQQTDREAELRTIRKMVELYPNPADVRQGMILVSNAKGLSDASKEDILAITNVIVAQSDSLLRLETFDKLRVAPPHSELATTLGDFFEDAVILLYMPTGILTLDGAVRLCDDFITKHPMLPYGYEAKGYFLLSYTKDAEHARTYLEKAMAFDTLRTRPHFYLAIAFDKVGLRKDAIREFRRGLQLDPASKWGLVEYGIFLTRGLEDRSEIPYLEELRQMLVNVINSPAQSLLQEEQHEHDVASAKELLQRTDSRLAELRSIPQ